WRPPSSCRAGAGHSKYRGKKAMSPGGYPPSQARGDAPNAPLACSEKKRSWAAASSPAVLGHRPGKAASRMGPAAPPGRRRWPVLQAGHQPLQPILRRGEPVQGDGEVDGSAVEEARRQPQRLSFPQGGADGLIGSDGHEAPLGQTSGEGQRTCRFAIV